MGQIRWDTALIIVVLFLVLFGIILTQIQVTNPLTTTPISVWSLFWEWVGRAFGSVWRSIF